MDEYDAVGTKYNFKSGGASHRPKDRVWIDYGPAGKGKVAYAQDYDEHAGPGWKQWTLQSSGWCYGGSYDINLNYKGRGGTSSGSPKKEEENKKEDKKNGGNPKKKK
ncbi:MAG: hypothetical protein RBJ76_08105 [Stenomitos frigidus ULC029]